MRLTCRFISVAVIVAAILVSGAASAATITWDGGGDGVRWLDNLNWVGDVLPGSGDDVVIPSLPSAVVHDVGSTTVTSLSSDASLEVVASSLTATGAVVVAIGMTVTADGGAASFSGGGLATVNGASLLAINGGVISLPGAPTYDHSSTNSNQTRILRAQGASSRLELPGLTTITNGTNYGSRIIIEALVGATIDLGSLTHIADGIGGDDRQHAVLVTADDVGSLVDLPLLVQMEDVNTDLRSSLTATDNGTINAPVLATLSGVSLTLDGTGVLPVAQMATLTNCSVVVSNNPVTLTNLTHAPGTRFTSNGVHLDLGQLTDISRGSVTLEGGGTVDLSLASDIDGASFIVNDGVTLAVPSATGYDHSATGTNQTRVLRAVGAGSVLSLANLTVMSNGTTYGSKIVIEALAGATVDLGSLGQILDPAAGDTRVRHVVITADGPGSVVDLSSLTIFEDRNTDSRSHLNPVNGGVIMTPLLTDLTGVILNLDGTGTLPVAQMQAMINGSVSISGSDQLFPSLTLATGTFFIIDGVHADLSQVIDFNRSSVTLTGGGTTDLSSAAAIDGASFAVNDGVTLSLPAATSYAHGSTQNNQTRTWHAQGAGSSLELANVVSITGGGLYGSKMAIEALDGGAIDLGAVALITDTAGGDARQRQVRVVADGPGSVIDLTSLATVDDLDIDLRSVLSVSGGGSIDAPILADLTGFSLDLDGTGTFPVGQILTMTNGAVTVSGIDQAFAALTQARGTIFTANGVHVDLGQLTDLTRSTVELTSGGTADLDLVSVIDGASFLVAGGVSLLLPSIPSSYDFASTGNSQTRTFRAEGAGSVLDLSNLTSIANGTHYGSTFVIEALTGGRIELGMVTEIVDPAPGDTRQRDVLITAEGFGSVIDLSNLLVFHDLNGDLPSRISALNGGLVQWDSGQASLLNVIVSFTEADLGLVLGDAPDPVEAGFPVDFTVSVANAGPGVAFLLSVTTTLPSSYAFGSAAGTDWVCSESMSTVTCTRDSLAVGSAPDITISATPQLPGIFTTTAAAWAVELDSTPDDAAATEPTTVFNPEYAPTTSVVGGGVAINEVLIDPVGDPEVFDTDGNGSADPLDEFVELFNASDVPVDLSGFELWDATGPWFTFPGAPGSETTVLFPETFAVVVVGVQGGGSLPLVAGDNLAFDAAQATPVLDDTADNVVLYDPGADEFVQLLYGGAGQDDPPNDYAGFSLSAVRNGSAEDWGLTLEGVSLTRDPSGDVTVVEHNTVSTELASPGSGHRVADLQITKDDGQTVVVAGESLTYTVVASNPVGPVDVIGATVLDAFPTALVGCSWTCAGAGGGVCTAGPVTADINDVIDLPVGANVTYTVDCTVASSGVGELSNGAEVVPPPDIDDLDPGNNTAWDATTMVAVADISVSKDDSLLTVYPGQPTTYQIVVDNAGPSDAPMVDIVDSFVSDLVGCSWACTPGPGAGCVPDTGSGDLISTAALPAGAIISFQVDCTVDPIATGAVVNTAGIVGLHGVDDPDLGNNWDTDVDLVLPEADLAITKNDGRSEIVETHDTTYTIVVSNAGPNDVPNALVTDFVPPELEACTWTCLGLSGAACAPAGSGDIVDWAFLPAGSSAVYTATCTVAAASGTASNTAEVALPMGFNDPNPGDTSATDVDFITALADFIFTDGFETGDPSGWSDVQPPLVLKTVALTHETDELTIYLVLNEAALPRLGPITAPLLVGHSNRRSLVGLDLSGSGTGISIRAWAQSDDGSRQVTGWVPLFHPQEAIELRWRRSLPDLDDGLVELFFDGRPPVVIDGIDNDDRALSDLGIAHDHQGRTVFLEVTTTRH